MRTFVPYTLSAGGNWSFESVRQLWERCEPRGLVTIHRCGMLTGRRWQLSRAEVCVRTHAAATCTRERACVRVAPARIQKFVNGCRDCRHTWDSSGFQTTGDKTGGREAYKREGLSARVIHSATGTGAMFHQIKAPLFEEHAALQPRCTGNIKRQQRRAAFGRPCAKKLINNSHTTGRNACFAVHFLK